MDLTGDVDGHDDIGFSRRGPDTTTLVDNDAQGPGGDGLVLLEFTATTSGESWTITDITFSASGSADEQAAISEIGLYRDDGNGTWDGPSVDDLATSAVGTSFDAPDGSYTATLPSATLTSLTTHRYFLVVKLSGQAVTGETFHAEISNVNASSTGTGSVLGIPTNGATPALEIDTASLEVIFKGPNSFGNAVDGNSQGPNNEGHVIAEIDVEALNDAWTVTDLTFSASGTADEQAGISFLALYVDDGNGNFDGPATDILADGGGTGVSFDAPDGDYTAVLTAAASDFAVNGSKTFFLVAKLSGTAVTGETFRASLTGMTESSPSGGSVSGIPTPQTSALVIADAALSVLRGPDNPSGRTYEAPGMAHTEVLAQFRFVAANGDFAVSGFNLSTGGGGDWVNHLDASSGVEVYQDDGDGSFDDASDTLLFSGPGNSPSMGVNFNVVPVLDVLSGETEDLWLVLHFTAGAGGSPYEPFSTSIAAPNDVLLSNPPPGSSVNFGTPNPSSETLRIVLFEVTNFDPQTDVEAGGASITIDGSGFGPSPVVTINGVLCPGTAVVDAGGTQITGLTVPPGTGENVPIEIDTNGLGVKTLTQTFSYGDPDDGDSGDSGGGSSSSGGGGCTATSSTTLPILLATLALLGLTAYRRRKVV